VTSSHPQENKPASVAAAAEQGHAEVAVTGGHGGLGQMMMMMGWTVTPAAHSLDSPPPWTATG